MREVECHPLKVAEEKESKSVEEEEMMTDEEKEKDLKQQQQHQQLQQQRKKQQEEEDELMMHVRISQDMTLLVFLLVTLYILIYLVVVERSSRKEIVSFLKDSYYVRTVPIPSAYEYTHKVTAQ